MSYLPSIVLAVFGFLMVGALVFRTIRGLRRFRSTLSMVVARTNDRAGLVRARSAGLRVAIDQRRRSPANR